MIRNLEEKHAVDLEMDDFLFGFMRPAMPARNPLLNYREHVYEEYPIIGIFGVHHYWGASMYVFL